MKSTKKNRILIRATNWIGDSVMSLPALEHLKQSFPNSYICVLLRPWVLPIFESHPAVDDFIIYDKKGQKLQDLKNLLRIIKVIKRKNFDIAILFQNAFEAALIAYFSGIKTRIGLNTDLRSALLTHPVKRKSMQHHIKNYLDIISTLGIKVQDKFPVLYLKNEYITKAKDILIHVGTNSNSIIVGLAMYGPAKRWPVEYFSKIGDWAVKRWNAKVVIMGSNKEYEICAKVADLMSKKAINISGKTSLGVSMAIIKRCNIFVSNDSGLMHIAAALEVPTIGIFGSTDPYATGPKGIYVKVIKHDIPCSPCFRRECPYSLECLYSISPEEVWTEMEEMASFVIEKKYFL